MNYLNDDEYLAETLKILKQKLDGGHKAALLMAIRYCCWMRRPLPEWARLAFLQAYDSATGFDIKSWDEVFGRPHPKRHASEKRKEVFGSTVIDLGTRSGVEGDGEVHQ
jgi:hypothetical protein